MKRAKVYQPALRWVLAVVVMGISAANADERVRPASVLMREGYRSVLTRAPVRQAAHDLRSFKQLRSSLTQRERLPWPVKFRDDQRSIGNSMAEFQPFTTPPYFHGGCDLITRGQYEVYATVSGKIEAGHYSYSTNPDGSMTKFFKPWPQTGSEVYFEIAIITDEGVRFEFHHIDRSRLPAQIVQMLNDWASGKSVRIEKGTLIGFAHPTAFESMQYTHIHYNVILPDGTRVNPEAISEPLDDHLAPKIIAAYAIDAEKNVIPFGKGEFSKPIVEWVIAVADSVDHSVYSHPPVYVSVKAPSGEKTIWDFRTQLLSTTGKFPVLSQFFMGSLKTPDHGVIRSEGGYGTGQSLVRIPVPEGLRGAFQIVIADIASNASTLNGQLSFK